jgi:hypothetical protein
MQTRLKNMGNKLEITGRSYSDRLPAAAIHTQFAHHTAAPHPTIVLTSFLNAIAMASSQVKTICS